MMHRTTSTWKSSSDDVSGADTLVRGPTPSSASSHILTIALRLSAAGMSAEDRQHLMAHLQMTEQWLADEVRGLSPAQLSFRSAPDRWSVRECVSHLAVAEPDYWRDFMKAVKAAPSGTKSS